MKATRANFFLLGLFRPDIADKLLSSAPKKRREKTPEEQAKHLLTRFDYAGAVKAATCVKKRATKPDTIKFWDKTIIALHTSRF